MSLYDWFIIACIIIVAPLIVAMAGLCWYMIVRLIIDIIKYGWY